MPQTPALEPEVVDTADGAGRLRLPPDGPHNRRLMDNVHPSGWQNPEPAPRYHLVVIGAGTGGLVSAAIAAALGARVALVERHLMGGDCLNVGCVPSKAVIRAARAWQEAREARERLGGLAVAGDGDFGAAMERMRRVRADISAADSAERFRDLGVDVFLGDARFTGPGCVEVEGRTLRFGRAIIATGGRPSTPSVPGLEDAGFLTNETVWGLTELPPRMLVIGGGPIGVEIAQSFARFGSRVTVFESGERILDKDDPDAAALVRDALERDGVRIVTGAEVQRVERDGALRRVHYRRGGEAHTEEGEALLVAAGRAPNVEALGLDAAGVRSDEHGVQTDDRMQTSNGKVFAVGDVASRLKFTHAADAQARMVVQNALFWGRGRVSELVVPWVTYTSPELAHVGITAEEVRERGDGVDTITVPLSEVDRARLDGEDEGFLRVHLKRGSDTILGATLVAQHAGEIISQITQAMVVGTGLEKLGEVIVPYPTQAEVIRKAADALRRRKLTPLAKSVFETFFQVRG
jgi:pyruvate/2-oxoglutarate dehydrogenase complex dihydrolipoamide dehydrogenase (E3) component